ncbi:beta-propeller fold lactonase family protein [Roseomonas sp. E05]|uniref:lactonase family protein n=1 Tax=Roseomonas sp. E05 TaxID=3046310 RepID=UPI0024BA64B8|nr:beta-propeller fold lactonase family protein [Roseomonas sp. E05]MDJ0387321.1 beta-propeller fold lactonase family protein [Roseomonas sp. E05]
MSAMAGTPRRLFIVAAIGSTLHLFELEAEALVLTPRGGITLPAAVQYVGQHPHRPLLYGASSDRAGGRKGERHALTALRLDAAAGCLLPHGAPVPLPTRPIHVTADAAGRHLLTACNDPSLLLVHRLEADGAIGAAVPQAAGLHFGHYAHQVRVLPGGRQVVLVCRGSDASAGRPEDPGALLLFDWHDGALAPAQTVAPDGGYGFGPRHLDFHPGHRRLFVSVERQNLLQGFAWDGRRVSDRPLFSVSTLAGPAMPHQAAGAIRCGPDGRHLYLANRSDWVAPEGDGQRQLGGENEIAVFRIDPEGSAATLVQRVDPRGVHVRSFALDPAGRILVAASSRPRLMPDEAGRMVPAGLALFHVRRDGMLDFVRKHDLDVGQASLFWVGVLKG